ncbi:MAG: phospholipid carrier-dependent glycosyltransferase, partial [Candidatus Marinimicrobia bacterium]|nr:phospholipid carrier-dependent glycosyltransferase [Candidatus Neomarinimicrobiota bacterium]
MRIFTPSSLKTVSGLIDISLVSAFFVWPVGEFALNDDWAHTLSIYQFIEHGTITYLDWLAPFNYIPIIYGGLIAKIVGFSFMSLRLLNVLFGIAAVIFLYLLLRFFKQSQTTSFLFALLLLFNPIFFNLSLTFMGVIPALTFMLAAI